EFRRVLFRSDPVGNLLDLWQTVRDEDDSRALVPEVAQNREKLLDLGGDERWCRHAEDQHRLSTGQSPPDLHHLPRGVRDNRHWRARTDSVATTCQEITGLVIDRGPV